MSRKLPFEETEVSVKFGLPIKFLESFKIEIKYNKKTYLKEIKPGKSILAPLDNGKLAIIRCDSEGHVYWAVLDGNVDLGGL